MVYDMPSRTSAYSTLNVVFMLEAVDCGELPTIPQASASDRNASVLYGSVVEYTCDTDHYFALGLQAINVTCDKNGKWTNSNKRCIGLLMFDKSNGITKLRLYHHHRFCVKALCMFSCAISYL